MKKVTIKVYEFLELDVKVREKVLEDFRYVNVKYGEDWSCNLLEDFVMLSGYLGVELCREDIYYRGFGSQGDGSSFDASVNVLVLFDALEGQLWKAYAPDVEQNFPGVPICKRVMDLIKAGRIDLSVRFSTCNRETSIRAAMDYSFERGDRVNYDRIDEEMEQLEYWFEQVGNVLNKYLYRALEAEYEYFCTDEAVIETINAYGYVFLANGTSATSFLQNAAIKKVA